MAQTERSEITLGSIGLASFAQRTCRHVQACRHNLQPLPWPWLRCCGVSAKATPSTADPSAAWSGVGGQRQIRASVAALHAAESKATYGTYGKPFHANGCATATRYRRRGTHLGDLPPPTMK